MRNPPDFVFSIVLFVFGQFNPVIANDYRVKNGGYSVIWIDDFKQLLPYDTYFIATEFFNVYPVHKFQVEFIELRGEEMEFFRLNRKQLKVGRK